MTQNRIINGVLGRVKTLLYWGESCVAACRTMLFRNNMGLWTKVAHAGKPGWDGRNAIIAGFIPAGSSVLDIGCGPQTLRQHLPAGCRYQPCDMIKSTPDVILCDLNSGIYPEVSERFDYVVCSGVFEYVRDEARFLRQIPTYAPNVILSYNPLSPKCHRRTKLERLAGSWVNHHTREELEKTFDAAGLSWRALHTSELDEVIYALQAPGMKGNGAKAGGN